MAGNERDIHGWFVRGGKGFTVECRGMASQGCACAVAPVPAALKSCLNQ
jgi:hypothetical protein